MAYKTYIVKCSNCGSEVERWKTIEFAESYECSGIGQIRHKKTKHVKPQNLNKGYLQVSLRDNRTKRFRGFWVARIVGKAFIENPFGKPQINHIDGNKLHNCVCNLEWVTSKENHIHARKLHLFPRPVGKLKFPQEKIRKVFELRKLGFLQREIAKQLEMGLSTVAHVLLGSRRKFQ